MSDYKTLKTLLLMIENAFDEGNMLMARILHVSLNKTLEEKCNCTISDKELCEIMALSSEQIENFLSDKCKED